MPNDDIQDKRLRARLALEGTERQAKREQTEAETEKQRQEAMLAMEGAERKAAREAKEKAIKDAAEREAKRLEEITKLKQLETDRLAAEQARVEEVRTKAAAETEAKVEKIHQAQAVIENLKTVPTAISSVRTLQSDLNQAVERRKLSAESIAIKQQGQPKVVLAAETSGSSLKTILIILLVIILLGGGGAAVWYATQFRASQTVPLSAVDAPKLMTAEQIEVLLVATTTEPAALRQDINARLADPTGAKILFFATQVTDPENEGKLLTTWLTPEKWVAQTGVAMPGGVARTLDNVFTVGAIKNATGATDNFLIFKVKAGSLDLALARMFDWEETIEADLGLLWPNLNQNQSTSTEHNPAGRLVDKQVQSLDARVLYDANGQIVLAYTFFNNQYLIITESETAIPDLINRLTN